MEQTVKNPADGAPDYNFAYLDEQTKTLARRPHPFYSVRPMFFIVYRL